MVSVYHGHFSFLFVFLDGSCCDARFFLSINHSPNHTVTLGCLVLRLSSIPFGLLVFQHAVSGLSKSFSPCRMPLSSILLEIVSTEATVEASSLRYWHYRKNWQLTPCIDSSLLYKYRLCFPPQPYNWWLLRFLNYFVNYLLLGHLVKTFFLLALHDF